MTTQTATDIGRIRYAKKPKHNMLISGETVVVGVANSIAIIKPKRESANIWLINSFLPSCPDWVFFI